MERVTGDLPPDPHPPKRGRGRSPVYKKQLEGAVDYWRKSKNRTPRNPWWLIAEHSQRRGSEETLKRFSRGEIELPRGTTWEFETRETRGGKGALYGRLVAVEDHE